MEIFEGLKPLSSKLISASHTIHISLALRGFFVYQNYLNLFLLGKNLFFDTTDLPSSFSNAFRAIPAIEPPRNFYKVI